MNPEQLREHFAALSDEALAETLQRSGDYTPEALDVARREAQERGLLDDEASREVLIHDPGHDDPLLPIARSGNARGWEAPEPDGEGRYAHCLLLTLARSKSLAVVLTEGQPVPDLADLATDAQQLEWVAGLPFRYDRLSADEVIKMISNVAERPWYALTRDMLVLDAVVEMAPDETRKLSFKMDVGRDEDGKAQLRIYK